MKRCLWGEEVTLERHEDQEVFGLDGKNEAWSHDNATVAVDTQEPVYSEYVD